MIKNNLTFIIVLTLFITACQNGKIKPVDIYDEDLCAQCRMVIIDKNFASEIITENHEVFKFDDIGCLEQFKEKSPDLKIAAVFFTNYATKDWIRSNNAYVIRTSIKTPMASGKIAVEDSSEAGRLSRLYPPNENISNGSGCCSDNER